MWPAGWVSGCPEALEGDNQRTQNLWVPTALGCPQEIYKELRRDIEKGGERGRGCVWREGMLTAVGSVNVECNQNLQGFFLLEDDPQGG